MESKLRAPFLAGIFGKPQQLTGGGQVTVDDNYLRESIMHPTAKVVSGYQPVMPTFQGQISEEDLLQLIAYIKTLKPASGAVATAAAVVAPAVRRTGGTRDGKP
jgi:cytochrome c oxidase subunit 2